MFKLANKVLREAIWWRWVAIVSWRFVRGRKECFVGAPDWFVADMVRALNTMPDSEAAPHMGFIQQARAEQRLRKGYVS